MTYSASNTSTFAIGIVSSTTVGKGVVTTLNTSIYAAGAQMEEGSFATSYIPTINAPATRAGDLASTDVTNIRINPADGTFGVEFQTISPPIASLVTL
jgi:hypothetical protein